jgi:hypothetical protein
MELCGLFQCSPVYGAASPAGKCASKELAKEQASDLLLFSRRSSINY